MTNLSTNITKIQPCDGELSKLLNYLLSCKDDEPFVIRQLKNEDKYYLREDKSGFSLISLVRSQPNTLYEDINSKGYERVWYKSRAHLKHRLIYETFANIPEDVDFDKMVIHHKNGNILDNRLENLYLISIPNHTILHKYIDKYGIENVKL